MLEFLFIPIEQLLGLSVSFILLLREMLVIKSWNKIVPKYKCKLLYICIVRLTQLSLTLSSRSVPVFLLWHMYKFWFSRWCVVRNELLCRSWSSLGVRRPGSETASCGSPQLTQSVTFYHIKLIILLRTLAVQLSINNNSSHMTDRCPT